ncbi:MAG: translation initiation factor IF-2 [Dehalococcoidales bacterium]|nr:translation initiation factor IF-2 [Dehalococcoidales bacterium]
MVNSENKSDAGKTADEKTASEVSAQKPAIVEFSQAISVRQLSDLLKVSPVDIIKRLMRTGVMANINQVVDFKTASAVATDLGFEAHLKRRVAGKGNHPSEAAKQHAQQADQTAGLVPRPPVVTIMGHVDHGKTKLLDAIRKTNVVDSEAGGITQHIGAYQVDFNGQKITFLDTPGHEAFTAMRARGAQVTDITVLVVAADDGVMPQTLEAIDHARAAGVPIVVAINKIDKPGANPDRVKQQLAEVGLVVEDWGGDTVSVPVSAKEKKGISDLLENLMVVAELGELKADPSKPAEGTVIEAEMDRTRGALFTVLVSSGTLKVGETIVVGENWGRVKAMFNDAGKRVKRATPSTPVEVLGLSSVPQVGDVMTVVSDEKEAETIIVRRRQEIEKEAAFSKTVSLTNVYDQISAGKVKELSIILKTDVQGSIEPIKASLEKLSSDEMKVKVIHSSTGNVNESDILLAIASKAVIIGFNTGAGPGAKSSAEREGVSLRFYDIIYNMVDDVKKAMKGMLTPTFVEVVDGHGEIRAVFTAGKKEKVAGTFVTDGKATRNSSVRVMRGKQKVYEGAIGSLRRFKDDVREVATGYECGVGIQGFGDFQVGDILEFFRNEKSG